MKNNRFSRKGRDPSLDISHVLCDSAKKKDWARLKELLERCESLNINNVEVFESFIRSLRQGRWFVDRFVELGMDVNQCRCEISALAHVAQWHEADLVDYLLERGAKVDLPANLGRTALLMACGEGSSSIYENEPELREEFIETIRRLLKAGANPNATDSGGYTALDRVVAARWPEAVELLLDHGARLDLSKDKGRFAVERAIAKGDAATMKLLIEFGLQPTIELSKGKTAIELAKKNKREDLVRTMQQGSSHRMPRFAEKVRHRQPKTPVVKAKIKMDPTLIGCYKVDFDETAKLMASSGKEMAADWGMSMKKGYGKAVEKFIREQRKALRDVELEIGNKTFTFRSPEGEETVPVSLVKQGKERLLVVGWGSLPEKFVIREVTPDCYHFACETSELSQFVWRKQ
jgi:hypothetical protein